MLPEFTRRDRKPVGELEDTVERDGLLGALDTPDLISVEVTHLRKLLLRELPFNP